MIISHQRARCERITYSTGSRPLNVADDTIRRAMSVRAASMNILITGGTGCIGSPPRSLGGVSEG